MRTQAPLACWVWAGGRMTRCAPHASPPAPLSLLPVPPYPYLCTAGVGWQALPLPEGQLPVCGRRRSPTTGPVGSTSHPTPEITESGWDGNVEDIQHEK